MELVGLRVSTHLVDTIEQDCLQALDFLIAVATW